MKGLGLSTEIVDHSMYQGTVERFRERKIRLPTFAQLANPKLIPASILKQLESVDPDAPDALNLFRVHWFNARDRRGLVDVPCHFVLGKELTGIDTPIVVMLGTKFPMIHSHKVLAAYACLAPRVLAGQFDPSRHRAIWPSTGNYCRGGAAISRIMACRGVAILPEQMSQARFRWLEKWTMEPKTDIIATYGCESNVKEIYDKCNELEQDPSNIIFNQFSEFGNHLAHFLCTGKAIETVFEHLKAQNPALRLSLYTSATGSAGTLAAGDYLREKYGSRTVAIEALECPTLLYNGFGGHNIQGIGDKHVPLIHNAMTTDFVNGISDLSTDSLFLLFNTEVGRNYLRERRHVPEALMAELDQLGFSSICNILSAIKTAKYLKLGPNEVVVTVASDGASMYEAEKGELMESRFHGRFDEITAAEVFAQHILGAGVDHVMECTAIDRERIFNLGYYTWVEQQGIDFEAFIARKNPHFWVKLRELLPAWDKLIDKFNEEATGPV